MYVPNLRLIHFIHFFPIEHKGVGITVNIYIITLDDRFVFIN